MWIVCYTINSICIFFMEVAMKRVFEVARYIIVKIGKPISALKLEKLTYYCQAWSLAWDGVPLFNEDFEAWANGPVCRDLYNMHRGQFLLNQNFLSEYNIENVFTKEEKETMDSVLDFYGDKEPHWLSELTHKERPWKETRGTCRQGEYCDSIINKSLIQEYYSGLTENE